MKLKEQKANMYNPTSYLCENKNATDESARFVEMVLLENLEEQKMIKVGLLSNLNKNYKQGMSVWETYEFFDGFEIIKSFNMNSQKPILS